MCKGDMSREVASFDVTLAQLVSAYLMEMSRSCWNLCSSVVTMISRETGCGNRGTKEKTHFGGGWLGRWAKQRIMGQASHMIVWPRALPPTILSPKQNQNSIGPWCSCHDRKNQSWFCAFDRVTIQLAVGDTGFLVDRVKLCSSEASSNRGKSWSLLWILKLI